MVTVWRLYGDCVLCCLGQSTEKTCTPLIQRGAGSSVDYRNENFRDIGPRESCILRVPFQLHYCTVVEVMTVRTSSEKHACNTMAGAADVIAKSECVSRRALYSEL